MIKAKVISRREMLQGMLAGLALCLLVYSLAQWLNLREVMFVQYALLLTGSTLFSLHLFGWAASTCGRTMPGWNPMRPACRH